MRLTRSARREPGAPPSMRRRVAPQPSKRGGAWTVARLQAATRTQSLGGIHAHTGGLTTQYLGFARDDR